MSGTHKHKCSNCSTIWEHSNKCAGNTEAHTCKGCGQEQWTRHYEPGSLSHQFDELFLLIEATLDK